MQLQLQGRSRQHLLRVGQSVEAEEAEALAGRDDGGHGLDHAVRGRRQQPLAVRPALRGLRGRRRGDCNKAMQVDWPRRSGRGKLLREHRWLTAIWGLDVRHRVADDVDRHGGAECRASRLATTACRTAASRCLVRSDGLYLIEAAQVCRLHLHRRLAVFAVHVQVEWRSAKHNARVRCSDFARC